MLRATLCAAFVVLLAGCTNDPAPSSSPETSPTTTAAGPGMATSIAIQSAPAAAPPNSKVTVCWTVTGAGTVPHTAIHWDNASHAADADRKFSAYSDGASYPGNGSAADPAGYALAEPARFCTAATMPGSGSIFVVAHVIDAAGAPGKLSAEREVKVSVAPPTIVIRGLMFQPPSISVAPGATVSVRNEADMSHSLDGTGFSTGTIGADQTRTFVAPPEPGTYQYHCAFHEQMHGQIVVTAA